MPKKLIKKFYNCEDIDALIKLLNVGLSLHETLTIIKSPSNKEISRQIIARLNQGELIESVLPNYLKPNLANYFKIFINYLSLKDALSLSLSIIKSENNLKNQIIKDLSYPICLLTFTLIGIYLFNAYCFDGLIGSLNQFDVDFHQLILFKNILDFAINGLMISLLFFLLAFLYFSRPKRLTFAYILMNKYVPEATYKEYLTSRFAIYFNACYKMGIKTKETLNILKAVKSQPLISFIAFHLDEDLLKGEDIEEAVKSPYLDERLSRYIRIARYSDDFGEMLQIYYENFKMRFSYKCKRMSKVIQIASYLLIGVLIIFIYQILFIPMGIIGGF